MLAKGFSKREMTLSNLCGEDSNSNPDESLRILKPHPDFGARMCTIAKSLIPRYSLFSLSSTMVLLGALLLALLSGSEANAVPPDIRWSQIETPHFVIVFDSRQQELGTMYAHFAEEAFASVSPVFGLWPDKTVILLDDSTDQANGSATGVPYPMITAYPVLPSPLDSISDYGNWGLELLTHEYTHVLNFEPATGIVKPFRYLLGSIVRPNILLPRWYSEGLAVEIETRYSTFGRLRSANYLSIIRAMVEDGSLRREDIARINEVSIPDWPGGARPYLMGALLMDELVHEKGDKIIQDLNLAYSRRVPFFINGPVEDRFGLDYSLLLAKTYDRVEPLAQKQINIISASSKMKEVELEQPGYFSHTPTVSPNGEKLAFIGKVHNIDSLIYVLDRPAIGQPFSSSKTMKAATDGTSYTRLSWLPDSSGFIHDGIDSYDRYYEYSDLYKFDLSSKLDKRLTHGFRAREPVVSADGKLIVFTQLTPGSTRLSSVHVDGNSLTILYTPPAQTRVSRPEFVSPTSIIFSEKRDDGVESFKLLKMQRSPTGELAALGEPLAVLADFKPVHDPRMTKEGLIFVSDRSGVANLYLADKDLTRAHAISNTTTRIVTGDIDPVTGDLYYSKLLSYGPQIFRSPRASWSKTPAQLPKVGPLLDNEWPSWKRPVVAVDTKIEDYSVWPYLVPRYWLPYLYVAPGVSYFSASTSASDPTNRHAYSVSAAYDTQVNATSFFGTYTNRTTRVPIQVTGYNVFENIYSGGFQRQTTAGNVLGEFFLPHLSDDWHGGLGIDSSQTAVGSSTLKRNGVEALLTYSNAKQRGLEISPEKGGGFSLDYKRYLGGISDFEYDITTLTAARYLSGGILPERNVVALFANASVAPRLNSSAFGTSTVGGTYQSLTGVRGFVMRGYNSGVFLGRNLYSATAEYRFPFSYQYQGFQTLPFFIQRWHADIFLDALTLDGHAYNYDVKTYDPVHLGRFFYGTGAEVKADTTIFYHVPMQFIFGLYYGNDAKSNPYGFFPFIGLGL
jgi:Tol biopolymer transport system component